MPWVVDPLATEHGTNVLGVLCGNDSANQFSGVAPNVSAVFLVSHGNSGSGVVRAITDAAAHLLRAAHHTGIILLEVEFSPAPGQGPYPAELGATAIFDAIRAATDAGITVVEAAGNGNSNLDPVLASRDSGAIIVGGGVPSEAGGWLWWPGSNFGRRIDCFAAGQNVHTATTQDMGYAFRFAGTSSAAAIIAGVAAVTQSMALHARGTALPPAALRNLLRDPKFGTASVSNVPGEAGRWIGNMPDLALIAQHINNTGPS